MINITFVSVEVDSRFLLSSYKLENDPMCGITTGGREECDWDCEVKSIGGSVVIGNPECFDDCFPRDSGISMFIEDYKAAGGICVETGIWPVATNAEDLCEEGSGEEYDYDDDYDYYDYSGSGSENDGDYEACQSFGSFRIKGICREETENALMKKETYLQSVGRPELYGSLNSLIYRSCTQRVTDFWCGLETGFNISRPRSNGRINPVSFVGQLTTGESVKKSLQFENTKHRYPWICSLRRRSLEKNSFLCSDIVKKTSRTHSDGDCCSLHISLQE